MGPGTAPAAGVRDSASRDRLAGTKSCRAYASLRTWCVRTGHGLGQKDHEADRWVAATAIWLQVPLVAHDRIFANVKDLELLTNLAD
jgi:predicted nucleic acid-binding protein